jgi:hypothetical protein
MARHIKTRDYAMVLLINGATKAGTHRDIRKHAAATACRGTKKTMMAQKKKFSRSYDWTRPAEHGDELFEIRVDDSGNIVEVYIIDEEGDSWLFNHGSFNDEELASIREAGNV